jgi:hypothetical protein
MHTSYETSEVYIKNSSQADRMSTWKGKSIHRAKASERFYECQQEQILKDHSQAKIVNDIFLLRCDQEQEDCSSPYFIAYRYHWQYPAITEKYAAEKLVSILKPFKDQLYLAFPWATLIDMIQCGDERRHILLSDLGKLADFIPRGKKRVITCCQHIYLSEYLKLLALVGVTDVFWSHASADVGQRKDSINIYPFPLYPVRHRDNGIGSQICDAENKLDILYSFAGATSTHPTRKMILDKLIGDSRGILIERESWHFQDLVYGSQIVASTVNKTDTNEAVRALEYRSCEYDRLMSRSTFAICPPGTGPNTIRLWEAIDHSCIPVLFANNLILPGSSKLWENAVVIIDDAPDSIESIPSVLSEIASNYDTIESMRASLACIRIAYGRASFVLDIVNLWNGGILQGHEIIKHLRTSIDIDKRLKARLNRVLELNVPIHKKAATVSSMLNMLKLRNKEEGEKLASAVYIKYPELSPL